jgi:cytochrome c oxidase subunit II
MARRRTGLAAVGLCLPVVAAVAAACGNGGAGASSDLSAAAKQGQQLARTNGCTACHGAKGQGGIGPAWTGALGSTVTLTDGSTATVDEAYLTRSIKDPAAQVVAGFSVSMPKNNLSDQDVADLVAYISALKSGG